PYIIFDIGVQLSYGGVCGIALFNKQISNCIGYFISKIKLMKFKIKNSKVFKNKKIFNKEEIDKKLYNKKVYNKIFENLLKYIKESSCITISANIVIIPIMMLYFNTISLSFVVSNLLAGSILGIIIIYAFILIFLSFLFQSFITPLFLILN